MTRERLNAADLESAESFSTPLVAELAAEVRASWRDRARLSEALRDLIGVIDQELDPLTTPYLAVIEQQLAARRDLAEVDALREPQEAK